ncbi:MAG TPA: CARDB domain-containing protein [Elusimicrobiota bacterium]|nr:CARDB domain-containing protein [Elusimicrobiota bacterium]
MKGKTTTALFLLFAITLAPHSAAWAARLASPQALVTDSAGASRTSYSSTERITLSVKVQNVSPGAGSIVFTFIVRDPNGSQRLFQTGNSAPATVTGQAGASLRGVPVSQFYTTPGNYTLAVRAVLDGETAEASAQFTVLSPVITLAYPPDGARDLIDQPLVFRWVSSGATKYRISVDDDASFYNALFMADSFSSLFTYPSNPPDIKQRLAGGQVYYWKVEGMDFAGNVVARTQIPFSFSLKTQAMQSNSRDLAVVGLEKVNENIPGMPGALPIAVTVKNQGGKTEANIPVNLFADGASVPSSPKKLNSLEPGRTERLVFPARPPEAGRTLVVKAILDFFDDNVQNNSMTVQFQGEERRTRRLTPAEMWDILRRFISDPQIVGELEGYSCSEVSSQGMSQNELSELVESVRGGKSRVGSAGLTP